MAVPSIKALKDDLDDAVEKFQNADGEARRSLYAAKGANLAQALASALRAYK